jgi:hypothetical protein
MRPAGSLTFKSYDTLASGFADYEKYLMYNRYSAARSASSPEAAAEALEAGHWAGGETTYGEKLIAAIKHYDLKQYDSGGSAGTGTTLLQAAGGDSLSSYTADNTTLTGSIMRFSVLVVLVLIIFISLLRVFPAVK